MPAIPDARHSGDVGPDPISFDRSPGPAIQSDTGSQIAGNQVSTRTVVETDLGKVAVDFNAVRGIWDCY